MLVTTDPSLTSLQLSVVGILAQKLGWEFYEKLRQNDMMIVQGNQQVSDNLKRGERLIAAGALDSYAADDRKDGHAIATVYPTEGTFVIPSPTGVVKGSPNPNAAKAFAAFMISPEVQKIFPDDGGYAARTDVPPPPRQPRSHHLEDHPGGLQADREADGWHQEEVQRNLSVKQSFVANPLSFPTVTDTLVTSRMVGRNYGLRGLPYVALTLVPAAFLKIGGAFAWRTLIAAELIFGVSSGEGADWGRFIFVNRKLLDIPAVFAGLLTVIVVGLVVENPIFRTIERNTIRKWGLHS